MTVAQLSAGASFGDMALLYNTVRTATIRCINDGTVFRISRAAYIITLQDVVEGGQAADAHGARRSERRDVGAASSVEEAAPWLFDALAAEEGQQKNLVRTVQELALEQGDAACESASPWGPTIFVVTAGELEFQGDSSKASRDGGLWRVSSMGELCTDTTLLEGDVFAIGRPGDEGLLAILYSHWIDSEAKSEAQLLTQQGKDADEGSIKTSLRSRHKLRLLGGSLNGCFIRAITDTRCSLVPFKEYLHLLPITTIQVSSSQAASSKSQCPLLPPHPSSLTSLSLSLSCAVYTGSALIH